MKCVIMIVLTAMMAASPALADEAHFFPSRPSGAPVHEQTGTLVAYDTGNAMGTLSLRTKAGIVRKYYLGYPFYVNGHRVGCLDRTQCANWPRSMQLGHSWIHVYYWSARYQGRTVQATDEINWIQLHK